jgi:hypothetical protein
MVQSGCKVIVTGDVMIESKLASGDAYDKESPALEREAADPISGPRIYLHRYVEAGGAVIIWKIIREVLALWPPPEQPPVGPELIAMDPSAFEDAKFQERFWRSNIVAKQFPLLGKEGDDDSTPVWRIKNGLGINRAGPNALEELVRRDFPLAYHQTDDGDANLVVVEHLNQGFSEHENLWPPSLQNKKNDVGRWLLVRWARPELNAITAFGKLVSARFPGRTIAIVSVEHLRRFGWQISRGLSWERTVSDLHEHVAKHWENAMEGTAHLIVVFFQAGAVLFSKRPDGIATTLIYDPEHLETDWGRQYDGDMLGFSRVLTAAVALQMMCAGTPGECDDRGIKAGLLAGRKLLIGGYDVEGQQDRDDTALPRTLEFPRKTVAHVIGTALQLGDIAGGFDESTSAADYEVVRGWTRSAAETFRVQAIDDVLLREDAQLRKEWRLLDLGMPHQAKAANVEGAVAFARDVVQYGSKFRSWCFPTLRFGDLFITDWKEMESFRALRDLMLDYLSAPMVSSPLCIAVFGSPGSGKSFAIKQLSRHLSDDYKSRVERTPLENVTFNVSQFADIGSLVSALHAVRDVALKGRTPLVFWDEFDAPYGTTRLGWLRYFLAPMQDGQFQEGPVIHNIGHAIFVFAGGNYTLQEFTELAKADDPDAPMRDLMSKLKAPNVSDTKLRDVRSKILKTDVSDTKIRDFVSRLKGLMEVPTLDYEERPTKNSPPDAAIVLRRAELLRAYLTAAAPKLIQEVRRRDDPRLYKRLNIDRGLIQAFLLVQKYVFGARSMEAIVKMSALTGKYLYDRSSLPPRDQLSLHVEAQEFLDLADEEWKEPTHV